jgi:holo-[acyl-carrier protein] synthase
VIISIGIDIIEVERIRQTLRRTPRFGERVFTETERTYCLGRGVNAAQHYAARFAAKEATLKALKTGWSGGIAWHDIEILSEDSGAPYVKLTNRTLEVYKESGANAIHLSISHTSQLAVAQVILERVV